MYPSHLDTPPPASNLRRPWSPDPYDPLPSTSSQMLSNQPRNQRREPSEVSVEALDLADYARTLAMRSAEHNDTSYPYSIPAYRAFNDYPPSPPSPVSFRPLARASQDTLSPPSLASASTSRSRTGASSQSHAPLNRHRPFSLPPSSYPQFPADLHSRASQTSRGHTHTSGQGPPASEIDISQFPAFTRGWYAKEPQASKDAPQDPFTPSGPNVFDPSFPSDTFRSDLSAPRLGYYSPPPSYPSNPSRSSRDYLPWSGDPPESDAPLDAGIKEERMRMLEREFGGKGKGKANEEEGETMVGSVDRKGQLITQGPRKRAATRWLQVLLALLAGGASIYAGVAIKPNPPAPPAGKPPLYILYAFSVISFLFTSYFFLIRPCCGGRRVKETSPYTQGPGGMMVLPVQSFPGGKKKNHKKKGGPPGGDVQVNLIVDPGMFGQSRRDRDEEDDEDEGEYDTIPGSYTSSSSGRARRKGAPKRRSVFDGLALEAQWKEARKWLKWGMVADILSMVVWGGVFVFIMLGKRCPAGKFDGWCDAYNLSTACACLLAFAFAFSVFFDIKDLHTSQSSPRTRT